MVLKIPYPASAHAAFASNQLSTGVSNRVNLACAVDIAVAVTGINQIFFENDIAHFNLLFVHARPSFISARLL